MERNHLTCPLISFGEGWDGKQLTAVSHRELRTEAVRFGQARAAAARILMDSEARRRIPRAPDPEDAAGGMSRDIYAEKETRAKGKHEI
ncbi:hypothetical protein FQA47_014778 [Oryzias melastigma]|uniref:Uncharacterized protein n=1 Tax=Oryzias melastigma TaxID=30732 RepID=A0A834F3T2_ORYME|nr:hypothetical protein FQA47_014778 [Oryzias melastigma]